MTPQLLSRKLARSSGLTTGPPGGTYQLRQFEQTHFKKGAPRMNVAIVGSRDYPHPEHIWSYVATLPADTVVVSGGARGVDSWAAAAATHHGLHVRVYPADWERYGKSAGYRRNASIVSAVDRVVAFWTGTSPGTAHSIRLARQQGKPVEIHTP